GPTPSAPRPGRGEGARDPLPRDGRSRGRAATRHREPPPRGEARVPVPPAVGERARSHPGRERRARRSALALRPVPRDPILELRAVLDPRDDPPVPDGQLPDGAARLDAPRTEDLFSAAEGGGTSPRGGADT